MSKRVLRVSVAFAVLLAMTSAGEAGLFKKKHRGFFDSLFGSPEERAARAERRRIEAEQRRQWWLQDNGFGWDSPSPKLKKSKAAPKQVVNYEDPEPIPGLGYGNVAFVLPRLMPVSDTGLAGLSGGSAQAESMRLVLSDKTSPVKADAKVRDAVLAFYKANALAPVWTKDGALTPQAQGLVATLKAAGNEGLEPARYLPGGFESYDNLTDQIAGSSIAAAQLDVGLSVAAASYAAHVSGGAFDPNKLSLYYDVTPEGVDPLVALKVLAYTPYPQEYLKSIAPQHPAYALLKAELQKLNAESVASQTPFPAGKRVKAGQEDDRIPELRERMLQAGFYDPTTAPVEPGKDRLLDKALSKQLKDFQAQNGVAATGALDQATVAFFNTDKTEEKRDKLVDSLERVRWLPKSMGQRHVFVNQAAFEVKVMDQGKPVWTSHVVVGKPTTQTYVFNDEMETVVFNPTWGMPASILINEYLGKLRRDPGYFDRIGYQVVNQKGKKVSSRSISWGSVGANSGLGVIQPAGDGNALGELKFLFPNSHDIYMHDTPSKNLFSQSVRAFSHGCVRVQNPREFAKVLLGLNDEEVAARLAVSDTQNVKLPEKVPVHLAYFTAWPDDSGIIHYYSDIYQRDKTLNGARAIVARAFGGVSGVKIVQAATKLQGAAAD
jgi:murein L,D-transpeptidase YcbB/YkuD